MCTPSRKAKRSTIYLRGETSGSSEIIPRLRGPSPSARLGMTAKKPPLEKTLFFLIQFQRRRVHAIANTSRLRTVGENMAEMSATLCAQDFGPRHHEFFVGLRRDSILRERLVETRPTAAGFELRFRTEERISAGRAFVNAGIMRAGILAGKCALGPLLAQDVILLRRQRLFPFCLGLLDLLAHI